MRRLGVTVLLAVLASACGGGGGGQSGIGLKDLNADGQIIILCFGDSITRGVGDGPDAGDTPPPPAGYPARLQALTGVAVIDDGNPGERTSQGIQRLRGDLEQFTPDYTILLEGTNDLEDGNGDQALQNLQSMIDSIFASGAFPVLGTLTPSCCNHQNQLPEDAILFFNDQLRAMARNDSVPVADFYRAFTGSAEGSYDPNQGLIHVPEGLHPTPAGYDVMASTARKVFSG